WTLAPRMVKTISVPDSPGAGKPWTAAFPCRRTWEKWVNTSGGKAPAFANSSTRLDQRLRLRLADERPVAFPGHHLGDLAAFRQSHCPIDGGNAIRAEKVGANGAVRQAVEVRREASGVSTV